MILDIEHYRSNQLQEHLRSLVDVEDLIKCSGCYDYFTEEEIERISMHDLNDNKVCDYCKECIEEYISANL